MKIGRYIYLPTPTKTNREVARIREGGKRDLEGKNKDLRFSCKPNPLPFSKKQIKKAAISLSHTHRHKKQNLAAKRTQVETLLSIIQHSISIFAQITFLKVYNMYVYLLNS